MWRIQGLIRNNSNRNNSNRNNSNNITNPKTKGCHSIPTSNPIKSS